MILISRVWRWRKVLIALMALEFLDVVACLVLFGIASPNTYRTAMWQIGSDNGFNSSPNEVLYAYANYRPLPKTPMIWSAFITQFNVVVSIFTMFLLLVKLVAYVMNIWRPLVALIANVILAGLWCLSVYGQGGPDYTDPKFPSPSAWYLRYSCSYARPSGNYDYCMQAKGSFAATCIMLSLVFFNLVLSIWSMIPTAEEKAERMQRLEDNRALDESPAFDRGEKAWEMGTYPRSPRSPMGAKPPFTPRTMAFNTLDRKLPLRQSS